MKQIWTDAAYRLLYELLVRYFGPFALWEQPQRRPGRGLDARYDKLCDDFARVIGARSGEAVKVQISFALPIRNSRPQQRHGSPRGKTQGTARTSVCNLAAALHAGFITNAMLPDMTATKHE